MNGAESLVGTLVDCGVDVCFANPGTSEMQFVAALDRVDGMRAVLGLFEGVVTGAADGYARMAEKPACTLLHLGPGMANGLANLHNARRASTPMVNIVGDHATYHAQYDAPLASDVVGFARPVSGWIHSSSSAREVAADAARAVQAAHSAPGQIATLILPADTAWNEADRRAKPLPRIMPAVVSDEAVRDVAAMVTSGKKVGLLMRGAVLKDAGLLAAGRIAAKTGVRIMFDGGTPRLRRGAGLVVGERIPYFAEHIVEFLKGLDYLILVGAKPPVTFFAYPGKPSWPTPDTCHISVLAHPHEDGTQALQNLADLIGAPAEPAHVAEARRPDLITGGALDPMSVMAAVGHFLPENAIIADESITSGMRNFDLTAGCAPHDYLRLTGGSIGGMLPVATGAAVACPDRKVVCMHGDGGAMYTLQSLWTQAREKLDVVTVIYANREYKILQTELERTGAANEASPKALSMLDLTNPTLDWVKLAEGMGVQAGRAETPEQFAKLIEAAMRGKGPFLIEAVI